MLKNSDHILRGIRCVRNHPGLPDDTIRTIQAMVFEVGAPSPELQSRVTGADCAAVEVAAHLPDGSVRHPCSVFRLDDEAKNKSLTVYLRDIRSSNNLFQSGI